MKKLLYIVGIVLIIFSLTGCKKMNKNAFKEGYSTNIKDERDLEELKSILNSNELSNIDLIISFIEDYNKDEDNGCNINDTWVNEPIKYDEIACFSRYEKTHGYMDGDCRITSYTLLANYIKMNKYIDKEGSYLMFDVDVIDNNKDYEYLKDKKKDFITLFNEIDVSKYKEDEVKNAFLDKWNEYGIENTHNKVSLISVVMHDNYTNSIFVGHTGLLIPYKNRYVFLEKIAFELPYQITIIKDKDELKELLFNRSSYFADGKELGPFIYENEKLLYSYK